MPNQKYGSIENLIKRKDMFKKIYDFFCICAYVLGALGGFGYSIYGGSWPVAIAIVALAAMAFPFVKARFKDLTA